MKLLSSALKFQASTPILITFSLQNLFHEIIDLTQNMAGILTCSR